MGMSQLVFLAMENWEIFPLKKIMEKKNLFISIYNPSHKLSRQMRKMVLFRLATSNVKPFLMTIR